MAEKNGGATWEWTLKRDEDDADFTDIDFSENKSDGTGAEPVLFGESSDAGSLVDRFVDDSADQVRLSTELPPVEEEEEDDSLLNLPLFAAKAREAAGGPAGQSAGADPEPAPEKKNFKDNYQKKYISNKSKQQRRKIILGVLALIVLVLLIIWLLHSCSREEQPSSKDVWTESESGGTVDKLVRQYFSAKKNGNAAEMRNTLDSTAIVVASDLENEAKIYEDFTDIKTYQAAGLNDGEYCLCVTYDAKFYTIDTEAPSQGWYYARPDSNGRLRLMTSSEYTPEKKTDGTEDPVQKIYDHLTKQAEDSKILEVKADVKARYNTAVANDSRLAKMMENLRNGIPEIPPVEEPTLPSSSEMPTEPTEPSVVDPSTQEIIVDPTVNTQPAQQFEPLDQTMYVTEDTVNMRSAPDTSRENVITTLMTNSELHVTGVSDEWYRVDYNGSEGYVYRKYVSPYKAFIEFDAVTMYVNTPLVNLRSEPVVSKSTIIREMPKNEPLTVVGKNADGWYKVRSTETESGFAYVVEQYVSATPS